MVEGFPSSENLALSEQSWVMHNALDLGSFGMNAFWAALDKMQGGQDVRVFKQGRRLRDEDRLTTKDLYDKFDAGATLVAAGIERYHEDIRRQCEWLNSFMPKGMRGFSANAYLTGPRRSGLDLHFDGYDVVIGQVFGSKRWQTYPRILPFPITEAFVAADQIAVPPIVEVDLRPQDCLYMRAGVIHGAMTMEEPSLHVTFGNRTPVMRRKEALLDELAARRYFPNALRRLAGESQYEWHSWLHNRVVSNLDEYRLIPEFIERGMPPPLGPELRSLLGTTTGNNSNR